MARGYWHPSGVSHRSRRNARRHRGRQLGGDVRQPTPAPSPSGHSRCWRHSRPPRRAPGGRVDRRTTLVILSRTAAPRATSAGVNVIAIVLAVGEPPTRRGTVRLTRGRGDGRQKLGLGLGQWLDFSGQRPQGSGDFVKPGRTKYGGYGRRHTSTWRTRRPLHSRGAVITAG